MPTQPPATTAPDHLRGRFGTGGRGIKVRFAPSPTGALHVGNARTALLNWLFCRRHGGSFLLRIDDTDRERSKAAFEAGILTDLRWMGLDWDNFTRQSARGARYDAATARLREAGLLYPCYETPEELDLKRKIALGQGRPPIYDRAALHLSAEEQMAMTKAGRTPHWRLKLPDVVIEWDDLGRGPVRFGPGHLSDPVLVRADGRPLYTLTSVVDDGELAITHVIRGEDHVVNTAVQIGIFHALGLDPPTFAHVPLMMGADGKQLSKRLGSLSLEQLRDQGIEAPALGAYLAHLGTAKAPEGHENIDDLARHFDLGAFGRAAPRFEPTELAMLNIKCLHHMPFTHVKARLDALGLTGINARFWHVIRENVQGLEDAGHWWRTCHEELTPPVPEKADKAFLAAAAAALPPDPWQEDEDKDIFNRWIKAVKNDTGRKGPELFMPLRLALTGQASGPELKGLLPFIGRAQALRRLEAHQS